MSAKSTDARRLAALGACSEATAWLGDRPLSEGWAACENGAWMLWLIGKQMWESGDPFGTSPHRTLVGCLVEIVNEIAAPHWRSVDQKVLVKCVAVLARYTVGEDISREAIREARRAAYATAYATAAATAAAAAAVAAAYATATAAAAAATTATTAAAYAATTATTAAAYAATTATTAADWWGARINALNRSADIVRRHYPTAPKLV